MASAKKTVVITGASTGIGRATAGQLAAAGYSVVVVSRDATRGNAAVEAVRARASGAEVHGILADLSSMAEVRRVAREVKARLSKLDILINCAGIVPVTRQVTSEGHEVAFATNVLAPFLLVKELLPELKAAAPARVVNFYGGNSSTIDFDNLQSDKGAFDGWAAYGQTKICDALLTLELGKRLAADGITVNAAWPGIVNTEGIRAMKGTMGFVTLLMRPLMRSAEQGARTPIFVATSPELDKVTGQTFGTMFGDGKKELVLPEAARDAANAKRLYEVCEKLVG